MAVQARFYVREITTFAAQAGQVKVVLSPVTRGEENKNWAKYTPSGEIWLNILNPVAAEQFECGKEYTITFEEAPAS